MRPPPEYADDEYPTLSTRRLHSLVVDHLARQIVGGELAPGTALPIEPELARRFGVSRHVVREAIRMLTAKGLVAAKHGSGVWVQPPERWNYLDPQVVFERARSGRDPTLLHELLVARRVLEGEVAAMAAAGRTEEDLAALRTTLEGMAAATGTIDAYVRLDMRFHEQVLAAAHNRLLREALRPITEVIKSRVLNMDQRPVSPKRSLPLHRAILEAIERSDPAGAREAMHRSLPPPGRRRGPDG
ncbi:MAG TPA: FadR/GntR family transcriptional regulator [Chloroflexota bacterium]|nr:FadR/GntR family transcriptional regulator [Chloroflexota bacterium]